MGGLEEKRFGDGDATVGGRKMYCQKDHIGEKWKVGSEWVLYLGRHGRVGRGLTGNAKEYSSSRLFRRSHMQVRLSFQKSDAALSAGRIEMAIDLEWSLTSSS